MARLSLLLLFLVFFTTTAAAQASDKPLSILVQATGNQNAHAYTGTLNQLHVHIFTEGPGGVVGGIHVQPPYQVTLELPPGMSYLPGGTASPKWDCSNNTEGDATIQCTRQEPIDIHEYATQFDVDTYVEPNAPLGPIVVKGTLDSTSNPLPPDPPCKPGLSDTGCTYLSLTMIQSTVSMGWGECAYPNTAPVCDSTWQPWEAGTQGQFRILPQVVGYSDYNAPWTLRVLLPKGITYDHHVEDFNGQFYTSCTPTMVGERQQVTCVAPTQFPVWPVRFYVNVGLGVETPGPVSIYAAFGNDVQVAPADCETNLSQLGCGRLRANTRAPRVPLLVFGDNHHLPPYFAPDTDSVIRLNLRNIGDGDAATTHLALQLPQGLHLVGSSADYSCNGFAHDGGEAVTCTAVWPLGAGANVNAPSLTLTADASITIPAGITAALDNEPLLTMNTLNACKADPSPAHCLHFTLPVWTSCGLMDEPISIYCDGFEQPFDLPRVWDPLDWD